MANLTQKTFSELKREFETALQKRLHQLEELRDDSIGETGFLIAVEDEIKRVDKLIKELKKY